VTKREKLFSNVLRGTQDNSILFDKFCRMLEQLGFQKRIRGSHHIFYKDGIEEIINLQPKGAKAKPYQVKQVRNVILKYKLGGNQDE